MEAVNEQVFTGIGAATPAFTMRTSKPTAGNKYYITKASGGWSDAVKGSPTDPACDVLANCVGYAVGRFNEIGGWGSCRYLSPVNAENFIEFAGGLATGQVPRLGACAVWQKGATLSGSDGAGHVAIVERVISDTEIVTSESGWGSSPAFWTTTRRKGSDGNWGQSSAYKFRGFIYNPAACCGTGASTGGTTPAPAPDYSEKVKAFQQYLKNTVESSLAVDGKGETATRAAAVKALQVYLNLEHNAGLTVNGAWSDALKRALSTVRVRLGTTGALAYIVQGLLYCKGIDANGFDGSFGNGASAALGKFQSSAGIGVDRIAGPASFEKLVAA